MIFLVAAALAAGLFAGAAIYVSAVEHPARVSCGTELAIREFAPSYKRGAIMQASLAIAGSLAGIIGGWQHGDMASVLAALLLGAVVRSRSSSSSQQIHAFSIRPWIYAVPKPIDYWLDGAGCTWVAPSCQRRPS